MKFKRVIAAIMTAVTLLTSGVTTTAFAETGANEPALCYELLSVAMPTLSFDNSTAYCETYAHADSSVTRMTMVQTLQRKSLFIWSDVDGASWTKTASGSYIDMYKSFSVSRSGTYRVEVEITMTSSNGSTETVTVHSVEVDVDI